MALTLRAPQAVRFERLARALLSPPVHEGEETWCREVSAAARALFRADHVTVGLPGPDPPCADSYDAGMRFYSESHGPDLFDRARRYVMETRASPDADPVLSRWNAVKWRRHLDVESNDEIERATGLPMARSSLYNEVMLPAGIRRLWHLHTATEAGQGLLGVDYAGDAEPFGEETGALLHMLTPALQAGVVGLRRYEAWEGGLGDALDACADPMLVFGADGRELHRNRALVGLLARDPEGARVPAEAGRVVRGLARPDGASGVPLATLAVREVATRTARYRLRSCALHGVGEVLFLVAVDGLAALPLGQPPPAEQLRQRFGFTRREAEVATLLVQGLTNREVAERLFVSPHTARHHTERVFEKAGISSRKELALQLRRLGQPEG